MATNRRKRVVASRRRREDDGEEEGSAAGDLEDDSLSEGSIISNGDDDADIEPSEISEDEVAKAPHIEVGFRQPNSGLPTMSGPMEPDAQAMDSKFPTSADTSAMMNGLKLAEGHTVPAMEFDEATVDATDMEEEGASSQAKVLMDAAVERSRREHLQYLKQRKEDPAFVPNRGGFFLHDNRATPSGPNGSRNSARGRGRGVVGGFQPSRGPPFAQSTDRPWAHDLHDSVSITDRRKSTIGQTLLSTTAIKPSTALLPLNRGGPNRSFSTSILLGKVPVIIHLPGMAEKMTVLDVAKKRHTLLPQHRPPLRRDKPVRVSLPDQQPRYIFPSTERSFIFIPRALRPNQRGFGRGRGRSSFDPSCRTSMYGGSAYTPSVAMSRRSSVGTMLPGDPVRSPGGSALPLPPSHVAQPVKPVVRFPPAARPSEWLPSPGTQSMTAAPSTAISVQPVRQSHDRKEQVSDVLTMHQPQPQKAVSVADIESPARFHFHPPAQQQEQPFHQQMPVAASSQMYADNGSGHNGHVRRTSHLSRPSGSPLSQIPERAIYAQPFQPIAVPGPAAGYIPPAYATGTVFYPALQGEIPGYGIGMGSHMPSIYLPGVHPPPYMVPAATLPAAAPADGNTPSGTVAHESNGMVFYYNSSQFPGSTAAPYSASFAATPIGGVVGIGGMMTPPTHFFYPPTNNGAYYPAP